VIHSNGHDLRNAIFPTPHGIYGTKRTEGYMIYMGVSETTRNTPSLVTMVLGLLSPLLLL